MNTMFRKLCMSATVLALGAGVVGCQSNAGNGAGLGAIIGHNSHGNTAGGAIVGGAVGAIAGGLIGNEADRQQQEEAYSDRPVRYYGAPPPPPPSTTVYEYRRYNPDGTYTITE